MIQKASTKKAPWLRRHKILTGFGVLLLGLALYLGVSWIIVQVQIHRERNQYMQSNQAMHTIGRAFEAQDLGTPHYFKDCSYTSNGAVFATRFLRCEDGFKTIFANPSNANQLAEQGKKALTSGGMQITANPGGERQDELMVYTFSVNKIGCFYSATSYSQSVPGYMRDDVAPKLGAAEVLTVACGGSARAAYFPIVKR